MHTIKTSKGDAYVAFLDVLGFTTLVENNSHEELSQIYDKALLAGITLGLSNRKNVVVDRSDGRILTNDTTQVPVNSLIVSDSVIIWTEDDSPQAFQDIVSVARGVMAYSCFGGLPLRGAISVGPVSWIESKLESKRDNLRSSVFGIGLTQAFQLEKAQDWAGCVIDAEAIKRYSDKAIIENPDLDVPSIKTRIGILEYMVPMKNGCEKMSVLDWVNHPEIQARSKTVADAFYRHRKSASSASLEDRASTETKLKNTVRFVRHVFPAADKEGMAAVFAAFIR
jgi:hypothetical protein